MRLLLCCATFVSILSASTFAAAAGARLGRVVVADAPVYVSVPPRADLGPLRLLPIGTRLRVLGEAGDWVQVEFEDPQWGRRIGWIQKVLVSVSDAVMGSSEAPPAPTTTDSSRQPIGSEPGQSHLARNAPSREPSDMLSESLSDEPANRSLSPRHGWWFNVGLGIGSLGCEDCPDRVNGLSGGLSVGTTIGDHVRLGVGTTGWARETVFGDSFTVGTLDARVRVYPSRTLGFFITAGLGLGAVAIGDTTEFGAGAVIGVGWDIRVGRRVDLTPFYQGFAMANSTVDANVGQLGLGVTIH